MLSPLSVLPLIPERYRMRARHREDSDLCGRRLAFGRVVDGVWITDTLSVGIVDKCRKYIRGGGNAAGRCAGGGPIMPHRNPS